MSDSVKKLMKHTDLIAAGGVVLVVMMLIIPLPPLLIDFFITINISTAIVIVVVTLYLPRALDFSAFPSLLLLLTLFRLAINVSVTRMILLHGDAGEVVHCVRRVRRRRQRRRRPDHVPDPRGDPVRGHHQRLRPRGRGRRALHARRDARQADGDRRRPQRRPADRRGGAPAPRGHLARGRLLRRDGRRLEVRQGRRDRRHRDRADQPRRRPDRRHDAAGDVLLGGRPALLAADRRRRPQRADPGAADLDRDRHPRHPHRVREGPRQRGRRPDPVSAQGAAGGRRGRLLVRADPGPAQAPVPGHRRHVRAGRLGDEGPRLLRAGQACAA